MSCYFSRERERERERESNEKKRGKFKPYERRERRRRQRVGIESIVPGKPFTHSHIHLKGYKSQVERVENKEKN